MINSPKKAHLLIWISVLSVLLLNTVSAHSSELVKVLGRGLKDEHSGSILQLQCVGQIEYTIEPGCDILQAILVTEKNEIRKLGNPVLQSEYGGSSVWDELLRSTNYIEAAQKQLELSWNDLSTVYNPKNVWKLDSQDWRRAHAFTERDFNYWQFMPLKIDSKTFSRILISLTQYDEGIKRKTKKGCVLKKIVDVDTDETKNFDSIGFVWTQVRQLHHFKGVNWSEHATQTALQLTPLLRESYLYNPRHEVSDESRNVFDVYLQKAKGRSFDDGTSLKCFWIAFFKSGTTELAFKDQICQYGSRKDRWAVVAEKFPSCAKDQLD